MGRITSGVGLVSGINSKDIIDQLIQLEGQQKTILQSRIDTVSRQKLAYTDLSTRLTSVKLSGQVLRKPSSFQNAVANSSNEDVVSATATTGAAVGSYQLQVARLVTTQSVVSTGFADFDKTKIGAGTITIEQGGGELKTENSLAELNGGSGVRRGSFRITDRSGESSVIDITDAVSIDDVVSKINSALNVQVRAKIDGDKLSITDLTGKTTSNLVIQDIGDGKTAADLGIVSDSSTGLVQGTNVNFISANTSLDRLNDGLGVRTTTLGTPDIQITLRDGSNVSVDLSSSKTIGDALSAINTAAGTKLKADFITGSKGIRLTDQTGGGGTLAVTSLNNSKAAEDLGLTATAAGAVLEGRDALGTLGTTLIRSLNGGQGFILGTIAVQSRAASAATNIDLSAALTVKDVIETINNANAGVTASLKSSGNGIQITDTSAGSGDLIITDSTGTSAADLGIEGTFGTDIAAVQGANLQRQWLNENTTLAAYNGGKGVTNGRFKITAADGKVATVNLTDTTGLKIDDVISRINAKNIGITASINARGDGLLLTDTTGGSGKIKVEDDGSTTAKDLNILGVAADATTFIDGSFEKTITSTATDTLATLQTKINNIGFGIGAQVINDGSGAEPFRLSLSARNSGRNGRITFDAGQTALNTSTLVQAQDAAVFLGDATNADSQPLLITSSSNSLSGVIRGVNVSLNGVSDKPVTLNVSRNGDNITKEVQTFTDNFNGLVDKIAELTKYDTDTQTAGLLLGDPTALGIQSTIYRVFTTSVAASGKYRTFADVGLKLGGDGKVTFDADKLNTAYADDPEAVARLFSSSGASVSSTTLLATLNNGNGVKTSGFGADIRFRTRDGSKVDVQLGDVTTLGDVITAINDTSGAKVTAAINTAGTGLQITDNTTGTNTLFISPLNGSSVANDIGISGTGKDGLLTGQNIGSAATIRGSNALGLGFLIEQTVSKLTDPVDGDITIENKTLDERTLQFNDRLKTLDKQLTAKRTRLETQFANMESVLAGLQSQQSAIGSLSRTTSG